VLKLARATLLCARCGLTWRKAARFREPSWPRTSPGGDFTSFQRSLGKQEELKESVHLNSFKNISKTWVTGADVIWRLALAPEPSGAVSRGSRAGGPAPEEQPWGCRGLRAYWGRSSGGLRWERRLFWFLLPFRMQQKLARVLCAELCSVFQPASACLLAGGLLARGLRGCSWPSRARSGEGIVLPLRASCWPWAGGDVSSVVLACF